MTVLDDILVPRAKELIATFGISATWITYAESYDPTTGTNTRTPTNVAVTITPPLERVNEYSEGDVTRKSEARVFIAASGLAFTPAKGQRLTVGADTFEVLGVHRLDSGAQTAAYAADLAR